LRTAAGPRTFPDDWAPAIEDRIRTVCTDGAHSVVYFYEVPDTSTFRYRVFNMIEALGLRNSEPRVAATYFTRAELPVLERLVADIDTLVICRTRYTARMDGLVARVRAAGGRILFDTDDLIFDTRHVPLILETLDRDPGEELWDEWFASISRIGSMLRLCDGAITTNQFLADRINDFAPMPTWLVPNFLNTLQLEVSDQVRQATPASQGPRGVTTIGYFSGTPTHNRDFEIVSSALARVMTRHTRLRLTIVGFLDLGAELCGLEDRITMLPLTDFLELQRLIGATDLNLVPLQTNIFTNSKSELKYFEAAVVNTPTVATPTYTYRAAIADGVNGYLVDAYDWEQRLEEAVSGTLDLQGVSARALEHVQGTYTPAAQLDAICAAVLTH
jgi:glycosyltransferase involved in cell wall biosynthesis